MTHVTNQNKGVMINLSRLKKENKHLQERYDKLASICRELLDLPPGADAIEDMQRFEAMSKRMALLLKLHERNEK